MKTREVLDKLRGEGPGYLGFTSYDAGMTKDPKRKSIQVGEYNTELSYGISIEKYIYLTDVGDLKRYGYRAVYNNTIIEEEPRETLDEAFSDLLDLLLAEIVNE